MRDQQTDSRETYERIAICVVGLGAWTWVALGCADRTSPTVAILLTLLIVPQWLIFAAALLRGPNLTGNPRASDFGFARFFAGVAIVFILLMAFQQPGDKSPVLYVLAVAIVLVGSVLSFRTLQVAFTRVRLSEIAAQPDAVMTGRTEEWMPLAFLVGGRMVARTDTELRAYPVSIRRRSCVAQFPIDAIEGFQKEKPRLALKRVEIGAGSPSAFSLYDVPLWEWDAIRAVNP